MFEEKNMGALLLTLWFSRQIELFFITGWEIFRRLWVAGIWASFHNELWKVELAQESRNDVNEIAGILQKNEIFKTITDENGCMKESRGKIIPDHIWLRPL